MRINCDRKPRRRLDEWHRWFAWYPVRVARGDCRWLEYVERQGTCYAGWDDHVWEFEYRAISRVQSA